METRIRIRQGDLEVECTGDDVFITTRLPDLVSELLRRMREQQPPTTPKPSEPAPTEPRPASIAGDVRDYFSGNPVTAARVTATGLTPELSGTSDAAGRYAFSGQAAGNECFLLVGNVKSFLETATGPFRVTTSALTLTAFAAAAADVNRQYTLAGLTPTKGAAIVIVHLIDASGGPLEMVSATDLILGSGTGAAVGVAGPFFYGPAGEIEPQLTVSHAFNGRARAAFLNVPPGDCTLQLTAPGGAGLQRVTVRLRANGGASIVEAALTS